MFATVLGLTRLLAVCCSHWGGGYILTLEHYINCVMRHLQLVEQTHARPGQPERDLNQLEIVKHSGANQFPRITRPG